MRYEDDDNSQVLFQQIIDYLEAHLLEKQVLNQLEHTFFLNRNVLNQMFRCICNMTITEYIRNRRLSLAACELRNTKVQIIHIAFKYNYETPEAFSKAFSRFYGFPPSFVRRSNPKLKQFLPLHVEVCGGWLSPCTHSVAKLTNVSELRQEKDLEFQYDKSGGEKVMINQDCRYHIKLKDMKQKEDWSNLMNLVKKLKSEHIDFKVDGKTMIFAHGLEIPLDKICITFLWSEEEKVLQFFHEEGKFRESYPGFRYYDAVFEGMKIRCMLYQVFEGMNALEQLYQNTDYVEVDGTLFHVQSLEFYYQNADPQNSCYKLVESYLNLKKSL